MALPELSNLRWTNRKEVAALLAAHLRASEAPRVPGNAGVPDRLRVVSLLERMAGPAEVPLLRAIALNIQERPSVRRKAVLGLVRCGAGLPGKALSQLLDDPALLRDPELVFQRGHVLALARSQSALRVACRQLTNQLPAERALLLTQVEGEELTLAPVLQQRLYRQWLQGDRQELDTNRDPDCWNRRIIRFTLRHETSRSVLLSMWRDAVGGFRDELLTDLQDETADWSFPGELSRQEVMELAHALAHPPDVLVDHFGRQSLLQIMAASLPLEQRGAPAFRRPHRFPSCRIGRVLHLLRRWRDPELDQWIAEHALGRRLSAEARWWLLWVLWERNRGLAATAVLTLYATGDVDLSHAYLAWASEAPQEWDRPLLREASLPHRRTRDQYLALCGLERLGEEGEEWQNRLTAWSAHAEPRLQLRALGGLARRGSQSAWELLVLRAELDADLRKRAEAVATLGQVDAASHMNLLCRTLAAESFSAMSDTAPAAEEAALALARLDSVEARTALLQAYLHADRSVVRAAVEEYVDLFLNRNPAAPVIVHPPSNLYWRRRVTWAWLGASGRVGER